MRPNEIAKSNTEHAHQSAFMAYVSVAEKYGFEAADLWAENEVNLCDDLSFLQCSNLPFLRWFHAIPNGGDRNPVVAGKLKAEGVRAGVSDLFLPYSFCGKCGLYIEFKAPARRPKKVDVVNALSAAQCEFMDYVKSQGYAFEICFDWRDGVAALKNYLKV